MSDRLLSPDQEYMTKRDYTLIAKAIRQARAEYEDATEPLCSLELALAAAFAEQNPRFDRVRFFNACIPKP